ncbi:MAG: GNAT family N-acetyltransferase [Nanoarchaeota archaeon]|nr:GNAT family N-acetyltransferase [Nanoarchaeota archaeon]
MVISLEEKILAYGIKVIEQDENKNFIGRGTLYILYNENLKPFGFIEDIFISSSHRRNGNGRKIMNSLLEHAKNKNCYKVVLGVKGENTYALQIYDSLGFKKHDIGMRLDLE